MCLLKEGWGLVQNRWRWEELAVQPWSASCSSQVGLPGLSQPCREIWPRLRVSWESKDHRVLESHRLGFRPTLSLTSCVV